jgi:FkbH-like protein
VDPVALPWLPAPGADWRTRVKALHDVFSPGSEAQQLAGYALDAGQSRLLSRAIALVQAAGQTLAPLSNLTLAVLSGATFDFIADALPAAAARHGVALSLHVAPLDMVESEALDPASDMYGAKPDATLVAVDHRWLGLAAAALDGEAETRVTAALDRLRRIASCIAQNGGGTPILQTTPAPPYSLFGSLDGTLAGSVRGQVSAFNARLPALAREFGAVVLDVAALAEQVGTACWFDAAAYNLYKLPFAAAAVPLHADWVGRLLGALRGKARKCLVLDLDNTCWGGVIGDDGLEGIRIGPGSAEGESFLAVQQAALSLKQRGVILAVSSKNDDAVARAPFRDHPDMALAESDIAVFQANWQDKASNLEAIARALNIGVDALVFLDDNAAERAQVRAASPTVAVPELPADPAHYPAVLLAAGYFEAVAFSEEDRSRADGYAANAQRVAIQATARNLGDYLSALQMRIGHAPFDALNRARIAQLINKSNQFNLTTRRYTEAEVAAMESDRSLFTLQTRLADRFGNFGMIGVVIARVQAGEPDCWMVDTWLMSCRVLGRKVEQAMLRELVSAARERGIARIRARYLPTPKNGMVAEHFDKLGFARVVEHPDGAVDYVIASDRFATEPLPFQPLAGAA